MPEPSEEIISALDDDMVKFMQLLARSHEQAPQTGMHPWIHVPAVDVPANVAGLIWGDLVIQHGSAPYYYLQEKGWNALMHRGRIHDADDGGGK